MTNQPTIQIYNEDCILGMAKIPDGSIGAVITDLPYNITDCNWDKGIDLERFWIEVNRVLAPCSSAVMFASGRFTFELYASNPGQFRYRWVWAKNSAADFVNAKNKPQTSFEDIMIFSNGVVAHKGKSERRMKYFPQGLRPYTQGERVNYSKKNGIMSTDEFPRTPFTESGTRYPPPAQGVLTAGLAKKRSAGLDKPRPSDRDTYVQEWTGYPRDVIHFKVPQPKLHPNQKPVDLLEYLVRTYTEEGETVLDATMGSGSTGVAAVNTGRNFIGFETDENFFNIAKKRIDGALNDRASNLFAEVET